MSRTQALVVASACLVAVAVAWTLAGPVAAAARRVFSLVTPTRFLVVLGVTFALSALLGRRSKESTGHNGSLPWAAWVAVAAAAAGVVWYVLGRAVVVPSIFADELIHGEAAQDLADHGSLATHGYGLVTPVIDSIAYVLTGNDVTAYRVVQAINVVVMVSSAFVAYPLARRALTPRWALVVAAVTPLVPWLTYARFALTEPDFYPVFLLFALALVRALEHPTWERQLVVAATLALAYLTRTQAVSLVGAVVLAVLIFGTAQARLRATLRAFAPTWGLYLAGGLLVAVAAAAGLWSPLGPYRSLIDGLAHPHGLAIWAAANLSALFLGLGLLVGIAAPLGAAMLLRRGEPREGAALAAVTVAGTAALLAGVTLLSESVNGQGSVHERDLFFAAPLILACALAWGTSGFPKPRLVTVVVVLGVVGCAALIPAGAVDAHLVDALSFKLWARMDAGSLSAARWIVVATAAAALVAVILRSPWPIVATVLVGAVGVAAAGDYQSLETRTQADRYSWVDKAVPGKAAVTLLFVGCPTASPLSRMFVNTEYFNSSVDDFGHLRGDDPARGLGTEAFALRDDGTVTTGGRPLRSEYVVAGSGVALAGRPTATLLARDVTSADRPAALVLWRVDGPVRLTQPLSRESGCV
jgi:hypothetical protein